MSKVFEHRFRVNERPENYIRHVNNLRYLEWFIDTAIDHANSLGWGMSTCNTESGTVEIESRVKV